jgi:glycosyltransferase involved in cell wall biosynthesis
MNFYGCLRIKNEARWIERVIKSIQPLCDRIFVLDDHSTDGTPELCSALGCDVLESPFTGVDESRDKNYLLQRIWSEVKPKLRGPGSTDWIVCIDGDEELEPRGPQLIRDHAKLNVLALSLKVVYLWDRPDQVRVDGSYAKFTRGSIFRMVSPLHQYRETCGPQHRRQGKESVNFHCGNIPKELMSQTQACPARLLHYGYMDRADRLRKYDWYNQLDPNNRQEDRYRHMVQGDLPEIPATARLMHGGPLCLQELAL